MKYPEIIAQMSLEDKVALCSGADFWTTKAFEKYGIPSIFMTDGPHGLRKQVADSETLGITSSVPATCFPTACATSCSWDRDLLREMGVAMGEECRQEKVAVILGPGVNIKRNPLCGRNFEYFSEDPFLAGEMAVSLILGVQSQGIGVSVKHFAANNQENQRLTSDSILDERTLREIYLPAFEKAVRTGKPATIMCAYNHLNGVSCSDNEFLLRTILREEWGFEGVIMTDWGAMNDRVLGFKAGLDLEMPSSMGYFDQTVIKAIRNGELSEQRLDESVDRLLNLIFTTRAALAENFHYDAIAHHILAKRIAANSAVLLKNDDHILPIRKDQKIAVIGALAQTPRYQGAGSSLINPTHLSCALDGFEEQGLDYSYYPGYALKGLADKSLLQAAVSGARANEIAIVFAGLTEDYESEGFDRTSMAMPASHNELIARVAEANPNTVVVLVGGSPVELPWLGKVKAVLNMYLSGQAGGLATVELLTGGINPSGKLAETYPIAYADVPSASFYEEGGKQAQYREGLYVGYRYYDKAQKEVGFPFGFGLSYTTFNYSDLALSKSEIQAGEELTATMTIQNTGAVAGAEVVQLYVSDLQQTIFRPERELKHFAKVFLKAGEEKQVSFVLNFRSFACYDPAAKAWVVPQGTYAVSMAASSRDIRLQGRVLVHGTTIQKDLPNIPAWYLHPAGEPTQADLEVLLGHPIEVLHKPGKGEFTLHNSLRDMQDNFIIRMVIQFIVKKLGKTFGGVNYDDPNFKMMVEVFTTMPMKTQVMMSAGAMKQNTAEGLVHIANGKYFKGIGALLRKNL